MDGCFLSETATADETKFGIDGDIEILSILK
jgi:hypothetical protein